MIKRLFLAIVLALLLTSCGMRHWSKTDLTLAGLGMVANGIDMAQTRVIKDDSNNFYEMNPYLNRVSTDKAMGIMFLVNGGILVAADLLPEYRTAILVTYFGGKVILDVHNYGIGVRF